MERKGRKPTYDELLELVANLQRRIAEQDKRIAELEAKLAAANKNSRNSSKPPSSDITKPKTEGPGKRRKKCRIGGQKGHTKYESNLTLDDADHVVPYHADKLPENRGRPLVPASDVAPKTLFQYELVDKPVELTAHVSYPYLDPSTGEVVYAPLPREVEAAGILGPRLTAFAACLKGGIHASYTGTEKVFGFLGVDVCRATICNKIKKVAAALGFAHGELLAALPAQDHINVDETGHKDHPFDKPSDHKKHWIWVFAASCFTVFRIFGNRSTDALREVLGKDCAAIIGADFYSAYKCFMKEANINVQFCWAHLIRDIKFLGESSDKVTAHYGDRLLQLCRKIFQLQHRRDEFGQAVFRRRMERLKASFLATGRRSQASGAQDMVKRLKEYGQEYFLFLENPQIEPTNNLAEQEVRHCVIDRRITQGTRGAAGQRWCERIWSVLATCARQQRDAFAFVAESVRTFYTGQPQPSLLPTE
jgi:transposase